MTTTTRRKKPARKTVAEALVLRTCRADMTSYKGFKWPRRGVVKCDDWEPIAECGNGLHGLLWGEGAGSLLNWNSDAIWLVVAVPEKSIVAIGRKVKFPSGRVVFCGDRKAATDYILSHGAAARSKAVVGAMVTSGDGGSSTSGDCGSSTSGDYGSSTSGYGGSSTSGYGGSSTSGDGGSSTSGYGGSSTSGDGGSSTSGDGGSCRAGIGGQLRWNIYDGKRMRTHVVYVGENGIKPNVPYTWEKGAAVEVKP